MKSQIVNQIQLCNFRENKIDTIDPDHMPSANDMACYIPQTVAADSEFRTLLIKYLSSFAVVITVLKKYTHNMVEV